MRSRKRCCVDSYEDNLPIWICGGIKKPLSQVWPSLKSYE